jgi:hypothetical protein
MTAPNTFYEGTNWEQSSEPLLVVDVQESDCWPVSDNSGSGTKDALDEGLHPVIAIGERAAPARPFNMTGVVVSYVGAGTGTGTDRVMVNIARGAIVRQWVSNILTYSTTPATYETTPTVGQPVYVDDSAYLSEGVTLSMSPLSTAGTENPLAGWLWYCQDEIADGVAGGARTSATFDTSLPNSETEQEYCIMLSGGGGLT